MTDFDSEIAELLAWQATPEGMVHGQVTALLTATGDLVESSIHGERRQLLQAELDSLNRAYVSLGRLVSRYRQREAA